MTWVSVPSLFARTVTTLLDDWKRKRIVQTSRKRHVYHMDEHKDWGDTIFWFTAPNEQGKGKIHGHLAVRPREGDIILCSMQSGRDALFQVREKDSIYPSDPPDQYFVAVNFAGYRDELPDGEVERLLGDKEITTRLLGQRRGFYV